jgi:cyclic AMP-dependent transcription factor ATF-4
VKNTEELLMEFEQIYDAVELTHLTPPQTPPQQHDQVKFGSDCYQIFNNIQQQHFNSQQQASYQQPSAAPAAANVPAPVQYEIPQQLNHPYFTNSYQTFDNFSPDASENEMTVDAARDLEVVDELVRSRCKELPDLIDDQSSSAESCASSLSPPHSEISYSSGRYSSSVYSNDDDWMPKTKSTKPESSVGSVKRDGGRKRRLPGVDKKSRKKEQNKNAATRYRQKKKAQVEVILEVEKDLAVKNDKLQSKYNDVRREVKYLKSLMRDLFKAKGMLVD